MRKVQSRDGTAVAFDRAGLGLPVIVVGGALSDRLAAATLAVLLAPRFTVLTYDRRGRGDSGDVPPYAVEREVEDVEALIAEAGGSAFVFGHSSGAALALEAAARGLAITRLALYEPPFIVDGTRPPMPRDYAKRLADVISSGRRGEAVEYFMKTGPGVPAEMIAQMRKSSLWPALEKMAHTLLYDAAVMGDDMSGKPLPAGRWASVSMPTLVMDGGASPVWARNSVQALTDLLPKAKRRTLDGQNHRVAPEAIAPVLEEFFAGP
jgi:pimeloyl-ACP methyl ester carboxylesterase